MTKRDLRKKISIQRVGLTPEWVCEQSAAIMRQVVALDAYCRARCVASYVSIGQEVDTRDLIRSALADGKQVGVPVTQARGHMDFQRIGSLDGLLTTDYGLLEPEPEPSAVIAPQAFDLIIVPGAAFDRQGNRLGLGGAFYDRFLAQTNALWVALTYGFQVVDTVPTEPHDLPVDLIVTEKEVIDCSL